LFVELIPSSATVRALKIAMRLFAEFAFAHWHDVQFGIAAGTFYEIFFVHAKSFGDSGNCTVHFIQTNLAREGPPVKPVFR
jgi:hypothetical protein